MKTYPLPESKLKKRKKPTQAVNNTVNKLILDRESCEKLHKKLRFAVFITPGIFIKSFTRGSSFVFSRREVSARPELTVSMEQVP